MGKKRKGWLTTTDTIYLKVALPSTMKSTVSQISQTYPKQVFILIVYLIMAQLLCLANGINIDRCFLSVSYNQLCHVTNRPKMQ